jgi:hypothetical protein
MLPATKTLCSNCGVVSKTQGDGFEGAIALGKVNNFLRWTAAIEWRDRDGITPRFAIVNQQVMPDVPGLVVKVGEGSRVWEDKKPTVIEGVTKAEVDAQNAAIPKEDWPDGPDGNPTEPVQHIVIVIIMDTGSGELFRYEHNTIGAHVAVDQLKEKVVGMRILRGEPVLPLVYLSSRPMRIKQGMGKRPHFDVIDYKAPPRERALERDPAPQLPASAPKASTSKASAPAPEQKPEEKKSKPAIKLAGLGDVKPATTEEIMKDDIPF